MATVTSFESLRFPSKSELRQFVELFEPLFKCSTDDARRQAVAALSQCPTIPPAVALFIGNQPISIAAIFLTRSEAIDDETLVHVARMQGEAHARAIARRDNLSPMVIDALVSLRQASPARGVSDQPTISAPQPQVESEPAVPVADQRFAREEALRNDLRKLARHFFPADNDRLGLVTVSDVQEALMVRFARNREASHFVTTLADTLTVSRWLAERIMLDISGTQLATTLISLAMTKANSSFILTHFYPHLAEAQGRGRRVDVLLGSLDRSECEQRVTAWRRADGYTRDDAVHETHLAANTAPDPRQRPVHQVRPMRDMAAVNRSFGRKR